MGPRAATIQVVDVPPVDIAALCAHPPSPEAWRHLRVTVAQDAPGVAAGQHMPASPVSYHVDGIVFTPQFGLDAADGIQWIRSVVIASCGK